MGKCWKCNGGRKGLIDVSWYIQSVLIFMSFFICGNKPFIPNTSLGILLFSNCNRHKQLFSEMFPKFYWNLSKWLQRFFRGFPEIFRSAIVQNTSERQFLNMNNCLKIPELWKIPEDTLLKLARLDLFFHNSSCGSISANVSDKFLNVSSEWFYCNFLKLY